MSTLSDVATSVSMLNSLVLGVNSIFPDRLDNVFPLNLMLLTLICVASITVSSVPLAKLIDVTPPALTDTPLILTRPVSKLTPNASPTLKLPRLSKLW